jgi:LPPG:FO 2-phospho-L-lactate transferase
VISIGPIISMPAVREAMAAARAPVVAVSPYVAGQVVKGPTDIFMRAVARPSTAAGVASLYEGLIDGLLCDPEDPDPPPESVRVMSCPTLMEGPTGRRALAERTLEFASTLSPAE